MSRVDVDWSAAETTIPFDPAVTDGFHTTFASWPPPNLRTSGLSCNLFSSINLLSRVSPPISYVSVRVFILFLFGQQKE